MASSSGPSLNEELQCSICLEVLTDPVTTSCGHNFCRTCLTKCWTDTQTFFCPLCKENFSKRPDLKINTTLREVVQHFKEKLNLGESEVFCDVCGERKQKAVKTCLTCPSSYCETHLEPHHRVPRLKKHKLINPVENLEDYICQKHERPLELFCRDDQTCVCLPCTEGEHRTHNTVPIEEESREKKNQLVQTQTDIHQMIQDRMKKIQEIQHSVELRKRNTEEESSTSVDHFTDLICSIERCQSDLLKMMEEQQKAAEKQAEDLIKELHQEITALKRRNTELEQLSHTEDHLHLIQMSSSLNTRPHTKNWTEIRIDSDVNVNSLKRALTELKKTLHGNLNEKLIQTGFASPSQNSADKPSQSASLSSATFSGFGDKFRPPAGSRSCDVCLLQNKSLDKKCVACFAPQPNTDSASTSTSDSKPAEAPASINSLFAPPAGSWECDTCLVNNKPEVIKCVACYTAKPGTGVKSRLTLPALSETSSTLSTTTTTATSSTATGLLGFGDTFKKPEGAWDCDVCLVLNRAQDVKCVSCLSSKPGIVKIQAIPNPTEKPSTATGLLGFGFKKPEGAWDCDVCLVLNRAQDVKCISCLTSKPGIVKIQAIPNPTEKPSTATGLLEFGDKFKKPEGPWHCDVCLVRNKAQDVKCVSCLSSKPGFASPSQNSADKPSQSASLSSATFSGFGDKFRPPAGSWSCDVCLLQNKSSDKKCVACFAPQPNTDSASTSTSDSKPAEAPASISSLSAPPVGSWECDTCLVRNKPEVIKCVACYTAKPGTGVKSRLTLPVLSETSSTLSTTTTTSASSTATGLLGFGDKFKKPEGAWDCDVCLVRNKAQDVKCVTCLTSKPGSKIQAIPNPTEKPSTATGLLGFGDKFKKPEGAWDCDVCLVRNKAQDVKCVSCLSSKPGAVAAVVSTPVSAPATSAASLLGFGDKFKKPEGSWECEVCCVQNKAVDQKCVACQSAKPGAKIESKGFSSSFGIQSNSTDSSSSGFKFGTGSTDSTSAGLKFGGSFSDSSTAGGFKFGIGTSDSTSKSEGFKFGGSFSDAGSGGVKLGSASSESTATKESLTRAFDFSRSMNDDIIEEKTKSQDSSTGFKFGGGSGITFSSQASGSENSAFLFGAKPNEKESSNSSFSFSAPQSKAEKENASAFSETASTTTSSSTTTTTAANAIPVFGKSLVAESSASKFVEQATKEQTLVTPTFTFGKPEEKKDTSAPSSAFLFGASKEAEKPTANLGFSFSEPDPPKDFPKPTPTLTFGKTAESTEPPKPSFGFGQSITDTSAPTPNFGFMANSSSTPASSSSTPSLFITPTTSSLAPTPAPSSTFVFGQNSSSELTMAKTFVFGQQDSQTPAPAAPSAAPAPAQPFQFGSGSNSSGPSFNFGAVVSSTPASAAPAPSANPSPFVFSSAAPSSGFGTGQAPIFGQNASQPSAPAFGSSAPSFSASASPASAFGAKSNSGPVFGQQTNPTPTFGSTAASTGQGGFQFGSTGGFGASGSNSNVFAFGGAAAPATPAASPAMPALNPSGGGFGFSQTPAFNFGFGFSQTPAFNIESGKSPFTPTPSGQNSIVGLRIKTAVRRRK
ncbi:unnamed protein product [Leuciscus chuanchicus]